MNKRVTPIDADRPLIVEGARVRLFRVPPAVPWEDATHRVPALEIIVVELTVDDFVARGFSYTVGVGGTAVRALLHDYCLKEIVGRDARFVVASWSDLHRHLHRTGMGALTTLALAAIDVAFWELRCHASGRPLYLELGGGRRTIPVYSSGIDLHLSPEALAEEITTLKQRGYSWFKIKVGRPSLAEDVDRIAAARSVLAVDDKLLLDANQAWDLAEAVRRARAFETFDPTWLEEPLRAEDVAGHAVLRRRSAIPIALGESLYTIEDFQRYLAEDAVDVLQPDVARVGGLTPWLRIADLASANARQVAPHFLVELSVHGLCAIDNGLVLEDVRGGALVELGLAGNSLKTVNGTVGPPPTAGHGVDFTLDDAASEVPVAGYSFGDVRSRKAV
jgi:L-alanine-DL-glutamate epimerase-like enolase superfamily enzyme